MTQGLFQRAGYWFPDYDNDDALRIIHHCERNMFDLITTAGYCGKGRRRLCIQAGGHIGIWPRALSNIFGCVVTFEPQPNAFRALQLNCVDRPRIMAHQRALSDKPGDVGLRPGADSGTWRMAEDGEVTAKAITIDSLNLPFVDAIILDIEGAEARALIGAAETIAKHKPVLHVEMLPRSHAEIEAVMRDLGYRQARTIHKDAIYVPD